MDSRTTKSSCFVYGDAFPVWQVGEAFGPVRVLSEGKQGELFVGTTKNAILKAAFPSTLDPIVQVGGAKPKPCGPDTVL